MVVAYVFNVDAFHLLILQHGSRALNRINLHVHAHEAPGIPEQTCHHQRVVTPPACEVHQRVSRPHNLCPALMGAMREAMREAGYAWI